MNATRVAAVLNANALRVRVGNCEVCTEFNWQIRAGECWGVLGRNGSGKTTLLHTLVGLYPPRHGEITLGDTPLRSLGRRAVARRVGLLPQEHTDPFPTTVLNTVLAGRHPHLRPWEWERPVDIAAAHEALAQLQLSDLDSRKVNTLSGGERRRVGLATLLTQAPELYVLDEPLNHLDPHHQIGVLEIFRQQCATLGRAVVMSMHDVNLAARYCDRIVLLFGDGKVAAGESTALLTSENLERLFAHAMEAVRSGARTFFVPR